MAGLLGLQMQGTRRRRADWRGRKRLAPSHDGQRMPLVNNRPPPATLLGCPHSLTPSTVLTPSRDLRLILVSSWNSLHPVHSFKPCLEVQDEAELHHGSSSGQPRRPWRVTHRGHLLRHDIGRASYWNFGCHHGSRPKSTQPEINGKARSICRSPVRQGSKEDKDRQAWRSNTAMVSIFYM